MTKSATTIFSVFGQIEKVIGDAMIAEQGKGKPVYGKRTGAITVIPPQDIPATARWNVNGHKAHYALCMSKELEREFDRRVAELRA